MRLLDVTASFTIREFTDDEIPKYAILSHTWGKEEVTFQDMQSRTAKLKKGYSKIMGCGRQAAADGWDYIWVDTCCIDKTSSQELSEAINSMYKWYRNAEVCYAYLGDVSFTDEPILSSFCKSIWFTRGWTLQELIAPRKVVFYASNWGEIGSKTSPELNILISKTTGIKSKVLEDGVLDGICVSKRMSWASKRQTTRSEDRSYSLMGLFDVNMPLLYGEGGTKSFIRLQEEIMKGSDDHSLFAWRETVHDNSKPYRGLLANCPSYFAESRDYIPHSKPHSTHPYSMTNKGLHIELLLQSHDVMQDIYFALLGCKIDGSFMVDSGIYLKCLSAWENQYCKIGLTPVEVFRPFGKILSQNLSFIYVRQSPLISRFNNIKDNQQLRIPQESYPFKLVEVYPQECWSPSDCQIIWASGGERAIGVYEHMTMSIRFGVMVMITPAYHCLFKILAFEDDTTSRELYSDHKSGSWSSCFHNDTDMINVHSSCMRNMWTVTAQIESRENYLNNFFDLKLEFIGNKQI